MDGSTNGGHYGLVSKSQKYNLLAKACVKQVKLHTNDKRSDII